MDARTHRVLARLRIQPDRFIYALRFSPDGRTLFAVVAFRTGASPASVQRFDARTGRPLERSPAGSAATGRVRGPPATLMLTRDGRRVITTSIDRAPP